MGSRDTRVQAAPYWVLFLTATELSETTVHDLHDQQLMVRDSDELVVVEWKTIRSTFLGIVTNRMSETRKLVRQCISWPTGFADGMTADETIVYIFGLLTSEIQSEVQRGISKIVNLHMFKEVLWYTLFQPINKLAEGSRRGRLADLYPEAARDNNGLMRGVVGTLITIIYQTFHQHLQGRRLCDSLSMYTIIMRALDGMYANLDQFPEFRDTIRKLPFLSDANIFPVDPKSPFPKTRTNGTERNRIEQLEPITEVAHDDLTSLPNAEFTFMCSQRVKLEVDNSYFYDVPGSSA